MNMEVMRPLCTHSYMGKRDIYTLGYIASEMTNFFEIAISFPIEEFEKEDFGTQLLQNLICSPTLHVMIQTAISSTENAQPFCQTSTTQTIPSNHYETLKLVKINFSSMMIDLVEISLIFSKNS